MDCIIVDMMPYWISEYSRRSGESLKLKDIDSYWLRSIVAQPEIIDDILHEEGFFVDKPAMSGAVRYLQKLMHDDRFEIIILTQPPRRADHAVKEKRIWMQERFQDYPLANMIFAHRKELIRGDLLFDDCPEHIKNWRKYNPKGITASIKYPYNEDIKCDIMFDDRRKAWEEFYNYALSLVG